MSETTTEQVENKPVENTETAETTEKPEGTEESKATENEASTEKPEAAGTDLPPEVLQRELRSARDDAAKYRTKYQEAVDQLKNAKSVQEFEAAREKFEGELKAANRRADLMQVINDVKGFPAGLKDMLHGDTYEELKAAAELVIREIGGNHTISDEVDGGLAAGSGDRGGSYDPHEEARRMREKARRGY